MSIVDLGAAPGSWSEFISRKFKNIKLVAIDLKELDKIENVTHIKGDFTDEITQKKIEKGATAAPSIAPAPSSMETHLPLGG